MLKHKVVEKNSILMLVLVLIVVSIGGLIEIAPLFYLESTIEKVKGMRPYSPLELAGGDIYIRFAMNLSDMAIIRWRRKACMIIPSNGAQNEPVRILRA